MILATWNVNSLNVRQEHLAAWLDRRQPDVVALQEIKLPEDRVPGELFSARGYQWVALGQPGYNGVLVAARAPLEVVQRGLPAADQGQARVLAVRVAGLTLVDLYCPQGSEVGSEKFAYKLRFYDRLTDWLRPQVRADAGLVLLGDLNIAPLPEDVWSTAELRGEVSYHPLEHERFRALLGLGLRDLTRGHLAPRSFTFWDYREGAHRRGRGMRIDHLLGTPDVAARVRAAGVDAEERGRDKPSDHAPVWVQLG